MGTQVGEGVAVAAPAPAPPVTHARLQVAQVRFYGSHRVERDTLGFFAVPEWQRGRDPALQAPVCYTRNTQIPLAATFRVTTAPSSDETVEVRGRVTLGSNTLEWTGQVTVAPGDHWATTPRLISSQRLPDHVACCDNVQIRWEANPAGTGWQSADASEHQFYVVLANPVRPPYWTLLDVSCRAADGESSEAGVVSKTFAPFTTRQLTRMRDGQGLTYWEPESTRATNTRGLLASSDGSGQCGSWSEFLLDMYGVHGISGGEKVLIVRTLQDWQASATGFLVKNWRFVGPGSFPQPFTHEMGKECWKLPGIPGQRNPNPPPAFFNHFIVRYGGQFYDPSYGAGPTPTQELWELGAIDGLFRGDLCGFPKMAHAATRLLRFFNAITGQPL